MSFEAGPIRQPLIQSSQRMQNNGGGGNLGYMQQKPKKKKQSEIFEEQNLLNSESKDVVLLNTDSVDFDDEKNTINLAGIKQIIAKFIEKIISKIQKPTGNPFSNSRI